MRKWFEKGLRFECLGPKCFACCTGEPGYVWLVGDEAEKIAEFLDISCQEFLRLYTFKYRSRISLNEKPNGDCVFLDRKNGCLIYPVRPAQCSSYPFWPEILRSRADWENEANYCPGINRGELIPLEEILARMEKKLPPLGHRR